MTKLCFGDSDVLVDLTLLNIIAVYSLSLPIIIFKITTENSKISLKLPIQDSNLTTGCPIHVKTSGQIDLDLINN